MGNEKGSQKGNEEGSEEDQQEEVTASQQKQAKQKGALYALPFRVWANARRAVC